MPPKKDDKKGGAAAAGVVTPEAQVEAYRLQNEALQRQLGECSFFIATPCDRTSFRVLLSPARRARILAAHTPPGPARAHPLLPLPPPSFRPPMFRLAADRTEKCLLAEKEVELHRARLRMAEGDMEKSSLTQFDITAEMTRQFRAMQETLQGRISGLEREVARLQSELAASKQETEEAKAAGGVVAAAKEREIEALKAKMEDMASEFGDMLAEAIRKMADRIEVSPEGYAGEGQV
jgi:hypothetical protein